jgi:phage gp36-like protein
MTVYALSTDFIAAFSEGEYNQLTDKDQTGTPDYTGFNNAIALASEMIDSAIGGRYVVPLTLPVSGIIQQICLDIARYYLYDDQVTDLIQKRYDRAMEMLKKIADGLIILAGTEQVETVLTGKTATASAGSAEVFTDEYLAKFP